MSGGHKYKDEKKLLIKYGYKLLRRAKGSHEIWINDQGDTRLISRSGSRRPFTLKRIETKLKRSKNE